jgi:hypothetical protein
MWHSILIGAPGVRSSESPTPQSATMAATDLPAPTGALLWRSARVPADVGPAQAMEH